MARREALTPDALTPETMETIRRLKRVADARGEDMAATALKWVLTDTRVTSLLVGISSVRQLDADLTALHAPDLTDEELKILEG